MDEQHISLFHTYNDFCAAYEEGKPREVTVPLLQALLKDTREHFVCEEGLLNSNGFPGASNHSKVHRDLLTLMEEYIGRFSCGEIGSEFDLLDFLRWWLTNHIAHEDQDYSEWLSKQASNNKRPLPVLPRNSRGD